MKNRSGRTVAGLLAVLVMVCAAIPVASADEKLDPIVERLGSSSTTTRVNAMRDLMRLAPEAKKARPILEQMLADPDSNVRNEIVWAVPELLGPAGTDLLERLFNDPDRLVRDGAIRAACQMFDSKEPRALCKVAAEDADYSARVEVLSTLKEHHPRHPDAAPLFRRGLEDKNETVQRSAVYGAQAARDPKAVPLLAKVALESSEMVAVPAVDEALATIATEEAVQELIKLLPRRAGAPGKPARPTDPVRAAAARALARIKDKSALPELRKLLSDTNTPIRIGAMQAMLEMKDDESVPAIAKQLDSKETRLRQYALRALRVIGDERAAPAIRKVLHGDANATVRATAVASLTDITGKDAAKDLEKAADDVDASVRLEVAGALAGLGSTGSKTLARLVGDSDPGVRMLAIEGLGQTGDAEQIPLLAKAAEDQSRRNKQVRVAVAHALGNIGGAKALDALNTLAADPDPGVRQGAAEAYGRIGGPKAVKALEALKRDKTKRVRNSARRALQRAGAAKKKP